LETIWFRVRRLRDIGSIRCRTKTDRKEAYDGRTDIASQDQAIAALLASYAATIQSLVAADALRSFGHKTDGRLPTTIVGLPTELGPLMSTLLRAGPDAASQTPPPHRGLSRRVAEPD
jgi:hypothetical protein